jgi:uncharacterized protein (UPF0218 family)
MDSTSFILPEHLRETLKNPLGLLVSGNDVGSLCSHYDIIISVGDYVSLSLIDQGIYPQLMVVDFQTKREQIDQSQQSQFETLTGYIKEHIKNPAGMLTSELQQKIHTLCTTLTTTNRHLLIVDGEEDLAALPAILYAPSNATIIYGMPYKGVVIVPSTEEYKDKVRFILSEM